MRVGQKDEEPGKGEPLPVHGLAARLWLALDVALPYRGPDPLPGVHLSLSLCSRLCW